MTGPLHPWERPPEGAAAATAARFAALVPELVTERLRLRAPRIADYPVYGGFAREDRGAALGGGDLDHDAWLDFCQIVASWVLRGHGPWTIEPRDGGDAVGLVSIDHEFGDPEPEIGWLVTPTAEGRGYATEAGRAALAYAFEALGMDSVVSYVDAGNVRSLRVAERLGGRRDPAAETAIGAAVRVYRHRRDASRVVSGTRPAAAARQ